MMEIPTTWRYIIQYFQKLCLLTFCVVLTKIAVHMIYEGVIIKLHLNRGEDS